MLFSVCQGFCFHSVSFRPQPFFIYSIRNDSGNLVRPQKAKSVQTSNQIVRHQSDRVMLTMFAQSTCHLANQIATRPIRPNEANPLTHAELPIRAVPPICFFCQCANQSECALLKTPLSNQTAERLKFIFCLYEVLPENRKNV